MAITPDQILPNSNLPATEDNFAKPVLGSPSPAEARTVAAPPPWGGGSPEQRVAEYRGLTLEQMQNGIGTSSDRLTFGGPSTPVEKAQVLEEGKRYNEYSPLLPNEELHAANQGWFTRTVNAGANLITKAVGFVLQNAGFVAGAPVAAVTRDISNMTDNFLVKAGDYLNEGVSNNFPVYHTYKYTEGNIWDKLGTTSWWLDDGIDRLALTASMFVPGFLAGKGLSMAGLLAKGAGAVGEGIADASEAYSGLGKVFSSKLMKSVANQLIDAGTNPALNPYAQSLTRAELYTWNTIGQAALNAKETQDAIMKSTNDPVKAAEGAKNSFWETIPITLASSMFELPQMFSTARTAESILNKVFSPVTGEKIVTTPSVWKTIGKAALTGLEHGQSESLQVAISRYNEDIAKGKETRGTIEGIFGDFLDNVNDPNGQNNIALGTIQGILTTFGGRAYSKFSGKDKEENVAKVSVYNQIQRARADRRLFVADLLKRDEKGKVVVENGKVVYDQQKLADAGASLAGLQQDIQLKSDAIAKGDYLVASKVDHDNLAAFAQNFFDDPNGMEHLTSLLKIEAEAAKKDSDRINDLDEHGNEITPDVQLSRNLAKVDQFRKIYDSVRKQNVSMSHLDVDMKDPKEVKRAQTFIQNVKNKQYFEAVHQNFIKDKLNKNISELASLNIKLPEDGKPIQHPSSPLEEKANDIIRENDMLTQSLDDSRVNYQNLVNKQAQKDAFEEDRQENNKQERRDEELKKKAETTTAADQTPSPDTIKPSSTFFKNAEGNDEEIQVGSLYEIADDEKKFKVSKDGEKFNVIAPDTTIHGTYNTQVEAEEQRNTFNSAKDVLKKVKVTGVDENNQIEVADTEGNTHTLNPSHLTGYSKILTEEDKQQQDTGLQDKLFKAQQEINKTGGDSTLSPEDQQNSALQSDDERKKLYSDSPFPRKPIDILFGASVVSTSSTRESDARHNTFMSRIELLPNNKDIYSTLIHAGSEEKAGVGGITALYLGEYVPKEGEELILRIYRTKEGYINQNGTTTTDIHNMVYAALPSTALVDKYGKRYIGSDENTQVYLDAWKAKREEILNSELPIKESGFKVSRGIPIRVETGLNPVINSLVTRKQLDSNTGVIEVVTTNGEVQHQGRTIKFPQGTVLIHNGSTLEVIENRKFTEKEIDNIYKALKSFISYAIAHPGQYDHALTEYLGGVLNFRSPYIKAGDTEKKNIGVSQMFFHNGRLYFGKNENSIPFSNNAITENEAVIRNFLKDAYINTNVYNVRENKSYVEIVDFPATRTWKSYQHFLLDDKHPDGTNRPVDEIPLKTNIRQVRSDVANDTNFKSKYSYNQNLLKIKERIPSSVGAKIAAKMKGGTGEKKFSSVGAKIAAKMRGEPTPVAPVQTEIHEQTVQTEDIDVSRFVKPITAEDLQKVGTDFYYIEDGKYKKASIASVKEESGHHWASATDENGKSFPIGSLEEHGGVLISNTQRVVDTYKNAFKAAQEYGGKGMSFSLVEHEFDVNGVKPGKEVLSELKDVYNTSKAEKKTDFGGIGAKIASKMKENDIKQSEPEKPADVSGAKSSMGKLKRPGSKFRLANTFEYTVADVNKEKAYIEEHSPFYVKVVDHLIKAGNGAFAHGMYTNAAITLSKKMEEGTGYHEYFHGMFDVFTDENEKLKLYNEFGNREGSYIDRYGKEVKYSEASVDQTDEQMAEEFRNFALYNKLPQAKESGIVGFFKRLWNFIKSLVTGNVRDINQFYRRIDGTFYKNVPFKSVPTDQPRLAQRTLGTLDVKDTHTVVANVVSRLAQKMYESEDGLRVFNELDFGGILPDNYYKAIYDDLENLYLVTLPEVAAENGYSEAEIFNTLYPIWQSIKDNWDTPHPNKTSVKKLVGEYLRTLSITQKIDEDKDSESSEYAGRTPESYLVDSWSYDAKKNAPATVKMMFATIQQSVFENDNLEQEGIPTVVADPDQSTQLEKMVESAKMFNFTLSKLSSLNSLKEKEAEIEKLSKQFPNYARIAARLFIDKDQNKLSLGEWAHKIKFYNTFSKQAPPAYIQYVQKDDSVTIGSANPKDSIDEYKESWLQSLKESSIVSYQNKIYYLSVSGFQTDTKTPHQKFDWLSKLGIDFSPAQQSIISQNGQLDTLGTAISGIKHSWQGKKTIKASTVKSLDLDKRLNTIFKIYFDTKSLSPEGTFVGLEGSRRAEFTQTNAISRINNDVNNAKNKEELFELLPHLNTEYAKDSVYLNEELFDQDGRKNEKPLTTGYIQGTKDLRDDSDTPTQKLTKAYRLMQSINSNMDGHYSILLNADAKTEWLNEMRNIITLADTNGGISENVVDRFWTYYTTEQELYNSDKKNRLFSQIGMDYNLTKEEFIQKLSEFIEEEVGKQIEELTDYGVLDKRSKGYRWEGVNKNFMNRNKYKANNISVQDVENIIRWRTANFMLNNTEMFKLYFGDPAAYVSLKSPYKYFKNWMSPAEQSIYGVNEFDSAINTHYNTVANTELKQGDPGYKLHKDYIRTVAMKDVLSDNEVLNYKGVNGADAQALAPLVAYRQMYIKNGYRWGSNHDEQANYMFARDRLEMEKDGEYTYPSDQLKKYDESIIAKGNPSTATFNPIKPIVRGHTSRGPIVDKYSIAPLTYYGTKRVNENGDRAQTNLSLQYIRMLNDDIDYMIMESGRKVGNAALDSMYDESGNSNMHPYNQDAITDVPFKWFGVQVETGANKKSQTIGTQFSKLSTINLLSGGIPTDIAEEKQENYDWWYSLSEDEKKAESRMYRIVRYEKEIRDKMIENGYNNLIKTLGITDNDGTYTIDDKTKIQQLLVNELYRREIADNVKDALEIDPNTKDFTVPLEAVPNYDLIKGILYSYVKNFISRPKVNGGSKIQQSGSGFEFRGARNIARTDSKGNTYYTNSGLKFYTKEEPWIEVGLPCHFMDKLKAEELPMHDENDNQFLPGEIGYEDRLIDYLNNTENGKRLLQGLGFRIPTQDLNSVEVFRVGFFLPEEYGNTVVVPEEITFKSGSDFDVDKLNTYLKNVQIDDTGVHLVEYKGSEEDTREFYTNVYNQKVERRLFKIQKYQNFREKLVDIFDIIENSIATSGEFTPSILSEQDRDFYNYHRSLLQEIIEQAADEGLNPSSYIQSQIERLKTEAESIEDLLKSVMKDKFVDRMYKGALENEWFETTEKLLQLPQNFDRLITPNNNDILAPIGKELEKINADEFGEGKVNKSVLSPTFINNLRHINVVGINARGIPVNNQNNTALSQKSLVFIDPLRKTTLKDKNERDYIGDADIKLPHNTIQFKGKTYSTISKVKDKSGNYISDKVSQYINGFVDIAKDQFLTKMGVTSKNAATFILLEKFGVPPKIVTFFMNQPIVREYQKMLAKEGYSYPFVAKIIAETRQKFKVNGQFIKHPKGEFPTADVKKLTSWLKDNIETFYGEKKRDFTYEENAFQRFILDEFLKYTVMSANAYRLMYAGNWDTGNFPSPHLITRRNVKAEQAQTDNIFSSINNLLNSTFEGTIQKNLTKSSDAVSSAFQFLSAENVVHIQPIIDDLAERKRLTDDDYMKAARKVEESFINFLSQNTMGYNMDIKSLQIDNDTSLVNDLSVFNKEIAEHPGSALEDNPIINQLIALESKSPNDTKAVKVANRAYEAITSNLYTAALHEIKANHPAFYHKLIMTAFLQSGIGTSNISFTELIPSEDFKEYILPAIKGLNNPALVKAFADTDSFYRNNWRDTATVPKDAPRLKPSDDDESSMILKNVYVNANLNKLAESKGIKNGFIVTESGDEEYGTYRTYSERIWQPFRVFTQAKLNGAKFITWERNINASPKEIAERKEAGLPTKETVLLRRVEYSNGTPYQEGTGNFIYSIYVPVNAWGNGIKGQEYYDVVKQSVHNNNTYKPEAEIENNEIIAALRNTTADVVEVSTQERLKKIDFKKGAC